MPPIPQLSEYYDLWANVNEWPLYVPAIDDHLRIGSFVHVKLPNQDEGTTTIARITKRFEGKHCLTLFFPLFPPQNQPLKCHPSLPSHSQRPIMSGPGAESIELYQTNYFPKVEHKTKDRSKFPQILFPAFVFTPQELSIPKNSWANGLSNVYIVRFFDQSGVLQPLPSPIVALCFPNENKFKGFHSYTTVTSRCYHESVWCGLYMLRKAISKILNKPSGQSEEKQIETISIGYVPLETFNYINTVCSFYSSNIACHHLKMSESYISLDSSFSRKKVKMTYSSGFLRFESEDELSMLRSLLGLAATYGSSKIRPTLKDAPHGLPLKRGHSLTVVKGKENSPPPDDNDSSDGQPIFSKRSSEQRVDFHFLQFNVRVTVGFQR